MKKLISFMTAVIAAAVMLPLDSFADSTEKYIPRYYFKANESEDISIISDEIICVSSDALSEGDVRINIGVYIEDESEKIYAVSAKWRSESDYVTLENPVDPSVSTGTAKEYTTSDGTVFTTDLTPFCYMKVENGTASVPHVPQIAEKPEINSIYFSYVSTYANTFTILGASSDEFPFTSFDAVVSSDTPEGVYDIVFATKSNTDGDSSVVSTGAIALAKTNFYSYSPRTSNLKIVVGDYNLGDINDDNVIDAVDASLALGAYAKASTEGETGLTGLQELAADVNSDGNIDAVDASLILSYYAYTATGGTLSFQDYTF